MPEESAILPVILLSLKVAGLATLCGLVLGVGTGYLLARKRFPGRDLLDTVLTLPMVLPPTVAGFFLLLIFSLRRPIGTFLYQELSIKVVQTWLGCILAAGVIAFPLMYRNARAAFEQVDIELIYAGRTLGMSERKIFWRVVLPSAAPGVVSGTILTFARALGEYGATSMLAGNIAGKTGTISQRIAMVIQNGDYLTAGLWVLIILLISFGIVVLMNLFADSKMKNIKKW